VAYDQDNAMFASRLWWLLRWMGHEHVAVLDGGFAKWTREERPTASGSETRPNQVFTGRLRSGMTASVEEVARISAGGGGRLIDVRAPERYRGEIEPVDRVPGHIPGAVNDPFLQNVDEQGTFRAAEAIRARLAEAIGDTAPDKVVYYCGSGVTACQSLLALEVAGLPGARLYPGSWSEWSSDPSRPIEKGQPGRTKKGPAM
jgi:thiosulfate/3-mercaptopyruvate sulfurtransferase